MRRALHCVLVVAIFALIFQASLGSDTAFAQSNSDSRATNAQILMELLQEVRALRQDLRTVTVASERSQILLSRVQMQQEAVRDAQKELDSARARLGQSRRHKQGLRAQMLYLTQHDTEESTPDANRRLQIENEIAQIKLRLQEVTNDDQNLQANETKAKDRLQIERSKLDSLQQQLNQLDQKLANLASQPVN